MMDKHLDEKLDLIMEMLRIIYLSIPNPSYTIKFREIIDKYTDIMSKEELKCLK